MKYLATIITSLYNCELYLDLFFDNLFKVEQFEKFELLLLHNAPTEQEIVIIERRIAGYNNIKHIIIPNLEGLYATWNRGIQLSTTEYLTNWNVDDRRTPNSLMAQYEILEQEKDAAISYGDHICVTQHGSNIGILKTKPDGDHNSEKAKNSSIMGPLPMWRKKIHDSVGYFDEQFRLVADAEFQFRVAHSGYRLVKIKELAGYFLHDGTNLSSQQELQARERAILYLRYGLHSKFNPFALKFHRYKVNEILSYGCYKPIKDIAPKIVGLSKMKMCLFLYIFAKAPYYAFQSFKLFLKRLLKEMNLYSPVK